MAGNTLQFTVSINDDGRTLKVLAKDANAAAAGLDRVSKKSRETGDSFNEFNKREKGVANATSNTTKAFSKQAQSIGGALVPAYATLAANVFAISAAFNALQRAAQFQQLQKGLEALGAASGIAMSQLSRDLQAATGNALSLEEAMRSTALVLSSGFDSSTLADLGEVAKNASIALGRDTTDSLARLTRGATKLEPELLDELGIMVRLDEAATNYAISLGKTANELTLLEKRTAFMNAVLDEGERKFAAIGEAVDTSAYDKLQASFADLSSTFLSIGSGPITAFVSVLAGSSTALAGTLTVLAGIIGRQMLPALDELGERSSAYAETQEELISETRDQLNSNLSATTSVNRLGDALSSSNVRQEVFNTALRDSRKALRLATIEHNLLVKSQGANSEAVRDNLILLNRQKVEYEAVNSAARANVAVNLANAEATFAHAVKSGDLKLALAQLRAAYAATIVDTYSAAAANGVLSASFGAARAAAATFTFTLRALGTAILTFLPFLGVAILAFEGLRFAFEAVINSQKTEELRKLEKQTEDSTATFEQLTKSIREIDAAALGNSSSITTVTQRYEALSNVIGTAVSEFKKLDKAARDAQAAQTFTLGGLLGADNKAGSAFADAVEDSREIQKIVQNISSAPIAVLLQRLRTDPEFATKFIEEYGQKLSENVNNVRSFSLAVREANKPVSEFFNQFRTTTQLDDVVVAFREVDKTISALVNRTSDDEIIRLVDESAQQNLLNLLDPTRQLADLADKIRETQNDPEGRKALKDQITSTVELVRLNSDNLRIISKEARDALANNNRIIDARKTEIDQLSQVQGSAENAALIFSKQREILLAQIDSLDTQIALKKRIADLAKNDNVVGDEANALTEKRNALVKQLEAPASLELDIAKARVVNEQVLNRAKQQSIALQQKSVEAARAALDAEKSINDLTRARDASGVARLTRQDVLAQKDLFAQRKAIEENAAALRTKTIMLEFSLLRVRLEQTKQELELRAKQFEGLEEGRSASRAATEITQAINNLDQSQKEALQANANNLKSIINGIDLEFENARNVAQDLLTVQQELLSIQNSSMKARQSSLALEEKLLRLSIQRENINASVNSRGTLNASDELRMQQTLFQQKLEVETAAFEIRNKGIELEFALLAARLENTRAELNARAALLDKDTVAQNRVLDAVAQVESVLGSVGQLQAAALDDSANQFALVVANLLQNIEDAKVSALDESLSAGGSIIEKFQALTQQGAVFGDGSNADLQQKIQGAQVLTDEFAAALKELGPQGEFVGGIVESAFIVADAFTGAFAIISDDSKKLGTRIAAGLGAVSQVISQTSSLISANARARTEAIDSEIEAEKARDGQSAASVARIEQLEKKKENIRRKEFETNKKLQMANAVISTAAGIAAAIASGPIGLALAPLIAAMGAAQLAIIAGTTYQGGNSSAPSGGTTALSLGSRSNVVDLATSRSTSGEIGFIRGEDGVGGPNNFRPSFTGRKAGAGAGLVVGERGPELFVPDMPGRVMPNQGTESTKPASNVNINITAMDSQDVERALSDNSGSLVKAIRSVANDHGKPFLEEVNPAAYRPARGGARRFGAR